MRTQEEIVARIAQTAKADVFGFGIEVLIGSLEYERAMAYIKEGVTREEWGVGVCSDDSKALQEARDYLTFAWGKAQDHRGISATRSITKLSAYAWLLGMDGVIQRIEAAPYAQYGAPKLRIFAEAFGGNVPEDEDLQNMMAGRPCRADCETGCGR